MCGENKTDGRFDLAEGWIASQGANYYLLLFKMTGFKRGYVKEFLVKTTAFLKVTGKPTRDNEYFFFLHLFQKSLHLISVILRAPWTVQICAQGIEFRMNS